MKDNVSAFHSKEYDKKIKQTIPYYEDIYQQVIDIIQSLNITNITWLDIGCGTGKMAEEALKQCDIKSLVLCDTSLEMIHICENKFPFRQIKTIKKSIQELVYKEEFDVITTIQVNHYLKWEDRVLALQNCYRALKQNGVFITFENFAPSSETIKNIFLKRWKNYQIKNGKSEKESEQHINRYGVEYYPISIYDHVDVMKQCGFEYVEVFWISYLQIGLLGIKPSIDCRVAPR